MTIYDLSKENNHICVACECVQGLHVCFWNCPIFDNELICVECCKENTLDKNIEQQFSEKLGRKVTIEEINERCKQCGRNYALQSNIPIGPISETKGELS